jgi:arsenate reductase
MSKRRVLIVCTGNSCRSQMAEGLWRELAGDEWEAHSAGSRPAGFVHPQAIEALAEVGIDISGQRSKALDEFRGQRFELVVTVCENAARDCPVFPDAGRVLHWPLTDPAAADGQQGRLAFLRVRDELRARTAAWLADPQQSSWTPAGRSIPKPM